MITIIIKNKVAYIYDQLPDVHTGEILITSLDHVQDLRTTSSALKPTTISPTFDDLLKIFRTHLEHLLSQVAHDDEDEDLPGAIITEAVSLCNEETIKSLWS